MFGKFRKRLIAGLATCATAFGACGVWAQNGFAVARADDFGMLVPEYSFTISGSDNSAYFYDSGYTPSVSGSLSLMDPLPYDSTSDSSSEIWDDD